MTTYVCLRCGKSYRVPPNGNPETYLLKAKNCCLGEDAPCFKCFAKNICQTKDPQNPIVDPLIQKGLKGSKAIWDRRGCRQ